MPKPLGPNANLDDMIFACTWTITALTAAAEMDFKRTPDEIKLFKDRALLLGPVLAELVKMRTAQDDFERGPDLLAQVKVVMGDEIQDRTVRDGNRTTKAELANKPGLGAEHAFGRHVDDLVRTELELEPKAVLDAAARLADVTPFPARDGIVADLKKAAGQQQAALDDRVKKGHDGIVIGSKESADVGKASVELSTLEGVLLARFPRQYRYVGTFFADFSKKRKKPAPVTPEEGKG